MRVSIIIPALNEAAGITDTLQDLAPFRAGGHEIILVDGGSSDETRALAAPLVDLALQTEPGRACQMNLGARHASGDLLWFVHADTRIPIAAPSVLAAFSRQDPCWGFFQIRLSGRHPLLRLVERLMNWRSRLSRVGTGDQGIFVSRALFEQIGGYPRIPLMEDIALSKALRRMGYPTCPKLKLVAASRRWEQKGVIRTILLMWRLRLAYFLGVSPEQLVKRYYP